MLNKYSPLVRDYVTLKGDAANGGNQLQKL
jgi:hypothetical protein